MQSNTPSFNPASLDDAWSGFSQIIYDYLMNNLFTATVVEVQALNEDKTVDVRPVLQLKTTAGSLLGQQDPIFNVPVFILKGAGCEISLPVSIKDKGLLIALKFDPSDYFKTHELSPTASNQLFSLSNGVFLPLDFGYIPNGITLKNGNSQLNIQPNKINLVAEENGQQSSLELTPTSLSGIIQGSVSIQATTATVKATEINLGDVGGSGIARIGDSVVVGGVTGQITTGSAIVKST